MPYHKGISLLQKWQREWLKIWERTGIMSSGLSCLPQVLQWLAGNKIDSFGKRSTTNPINEASDAPRKKNNKVSIPYYSKKILKVMSILFATYLELF